MNDLLVDMGISALLGLLTRYIPKNGSTKKQWKKAMLKVFNAIANAYKDDDDFKLA